MGYTKPVPVNKEDIMVGNKYYTCNYSGVMGITVCKVFDDGAVLVKVEKDKLKPFVRKGKYIFDNAEMAKSASRDWEKDERKRKKRTK